MNQPYARLSQPYTGLMLASGLCKVFGVQLYKNNALLLHILSILNSDWLQHACTQGNYATVGSAIVAIAIVGRS